MSRKSDEIAREIELLRRDSRVKQALDHVSAELRALGAARARFDRRPDSNYEPAILELTDALRAQEVAPERALLILKSVVGEGLRDAPDVDERVLELFLSRFFLETTAETSGPHSIE